MNPFTQLDGVTSALQDLGKLDQERLTNQAIVNSWFSWPSAAYCALRFQGLSFVQKLANWSGYGDESVISQEIPSSGKRVLKDWVVLMGQSLVGKSSVGLCVAKDFEIKVYDTDSIIESICGASVSSIIKKWGESVFREMEASILLRLLRSEPGIIVLGGGSIQGSVCRCLVKHLGLKIHLKTSKRVVWERLKMNMFGDKNQFRSDFESMSEADGAFFSLLWSVKEPIFNELATETIDGDDKSIVEISRTLEELIVAKGMMSR